MMLNNNAQMQGSQLEMPFELKVQMELAPFWNRLQHTI